MDIKLLPHEFVENMRDMLGDEIDSFMTAIGEEGRTRALRVNTLKIDDDEFKRVFPYSLSPAPFSPHGYLLSDNSVSYGNTPQHIAGLFYMQEPSAMLPVTLLSKYIGKRVLDLCAAPGGKTTQIASLMNNRGVLVANEVVFNRAKILRSNIERMGIRNCMVTSNFPRDLARSLPSYFDTVIVDAPCSGEGMLRKEPAVVQNWSMANVKACAERDCEILESVDKLLGVGGYLVYSTCTLNKYENEYVINAFLAKHRYRVVETESSIYEHARRGFEGLPHAVRVFPHSSVGEGHFACVLQKLEDSSDSDSEIDYQSPFSPLSGNGKELRDVWQSIASIDYFGEVVTYKDNIYMHAVDFPVARGINILQAGVQIAECVKGRIEPHHNAVTALRKGEYANAVDYDWDSDMLKKIIAGETVQTDRIFKGYGVVTAGGYGISLVKNIDGTLKNHFPKALRVKIK